MDIKKQALQSEILKAEFKILVARAHNAERRTEDHLKDCYICSTAEDWDVEDEDSGLCSFENSLLKAEIAAWGYVYDHLEWRD